MAETSDPRNTIKFYGRRKGKPLKGARQDALDTLLPQITLTAENLPGFLAAHEKQWIEIGFGDGEVLEHLAKTHPDTGFIGCEPFVNGVAALCKLIVEQDLKNIRIWPNDARLLLPLLPAARFERLYLLNSDPWPKKRHHKRRFVQKETLDEIHRILIPGGSFVMSTDHADLAEWEVEKTYFHGGFDWDAQSKEDWETRPFELQTPTRYQKKGLKEGRPTFFLIFSRR